MGGEGEGEESCKNAHTPNNKYKEVILWPGKVDFLHSESNP